MHVKCMSVHVKCMSVTGRAVSGRTYSKDLNRRQMMERAADRESLKLTRMRAERQGFTLAHFSAQPKPFWSVSRCVSSF